nr:hypothetical protein GCM10020092_021230 [Actinoplanes digitatis]
MRKAIALAAAGALAASALVGCGGKQNAAKQDAGGEVTCEVADDTRVGIATGNATGVYFALGNAYAEQINSVGGKLKATASETGASVQNIQQLVAGEFDVAFSLADSAADAINGTNSFNARQPVQALARIHTNYTQVIVRKAAGITDVAGMKGKRVSTGSPKSGTEVIARRMLTAAGLDPDKDVQAQRLDLAKTVDGIKDGSIDALFWSGGLPTPGITDLLTTSADQVAFLDVTPLLPELQKINQVYETGTIPAAAYKTAGGRADHRGAEPAAGPREPGRERGLRADPHALRPQGPAGAGERGGQGDQARDGAQDGPGGPAPRRGDGTGRIERATVTR